MNGRRSRNIFALIADASESVSLNVSAVLIIGNYPKIENWQHILNFGIVSNQVSTPSFS